MWNQQLLFKEIDHPCVARLFEVYNAADKIYIVMEYIGGGELFDRIVEEEKFTEATARFYFNQLIEGVEYCHNMDICHRDLKPENLLLDSFGNLKISDFGFAIMRRTDKVEKDSEDIDNLFSTCGTPNYGTHICF